MPQALIFKIPECIEQTVQIICTFYVYIPNTWLAKVFWLHACRLAVFFLQRFSAVFTQISLKNVAVLFPNRWLYCLQAAAGRACLGTSAPPRQVCDICGTPDLSLPVLSANRRRDTRCNAEWIIKSLAHMQSVRAVFWGTCEGQGHCIMITASQLILWKSW